MFLSDKKHKQSVDFVITIYVENLQFTFGNPLTLFQGMMDLDLVHPSYIHLSKKIHIF